MDENYNNSINQVNGSLQSDKNSTFLATIYNKQTEQNPLLLQTRKKDVNYQKLDYNTEIDTNLNHYSLDDILKLLDINLNDIDHYEELKETIIDKIEKYKSLFQDADNKDLIEFFEKIQVSLLGNLNSGDGNLTEAEKLLVLFNDKIDSDNTDKITFNNNETNQIDRKTVTKLLTVDSRFRKNYEISSETDFIIDLPYVINNVMELKLSDLEFPATYYPFVEDYENNYFWIQYKYIINNYTVVKHLYIYIQPGNYYHSSLIDNIQNVFTEYGVPLTIQFNLDYNNPGNVGVGDGKITIEYASDGSFNLFDITELTLNFDAKKLTDNIPNYNVSHMVTDTEILDEYYNKSSVIDYRQRLGWLFGYRQKRYNTALRYVADGILDIIGPKYLYLVVDDFNSSSNVNFFSNFEESLLERNILARISLKGFPFSIQAQGDFRAYSEPRYYFGPVDIHKLQVKLIDEYGRIVSLNGMDFSFALSLITIYSQT